MLRRPGTVWALAASLFVLLSTPIAGPLDLSAPSTAAAVSKNALYGLLGLLIVAPAVLPGAAGQPGLRHLSALGHYLGSVSYGVFAYHVLVLALVDKALRLPPFTGHFGARLAGTLIVSLVAATVRFYALERPLIVGLAGVTGKRRSSLNRRPGRTQKGQRGCRSTPAKLSA